MDGDMRPNIRILDDNNYSQWSYQMRSLLKVKELWDVIERESAPEPGELPGADAAEEVIAAYRTRTEEFNVWRRRDEKARGIIDLYVSEGNIHLIYNIIGAKGAWDALKLHHQNASAASRMRNWRKVNTMRLGYDESMTAHITQMTEMFNRLDDLENPMKEDQKVATLLTSVEGEYSAVVTAINAWPGDRQTLAAVKNQLIEEWEKKKERKRGAAFEVRGQSYNRDGAGSSSYASGVNAEGKFICYLCGSSEHFKRDCPRNRKNHPDLRLKLNKIKQNHEQYLNCYFILPIKDKRWIVDSGATSHMTSDRRLFTELEYCSGQVQVANGEDVDIKGIGKVKLHGDFSLKDVLWVPSLNVSLISVPSLTKEGFKVLFDKTKVKAIKDDKEKIIGQMISGHYRYVKEEACLKAAEKERTREKCVHEWHQILAHRNLQDIKKMKGIIIRECDCSDDCEPCLQGKMSRKKFPKKSKGVNKIWDVIVSDVCGPMDTRSLGGMLYYVTFIDVYSRYSEVVFIKEKSDVTQEAIYFMEKIKTQFGEKIKTLRSDRGGEYRSQRLVNYLKEEGIKEEFTVGYCPEQNGIAERKNRTLVEAARTMLIEAKLPRNHWAEAVNMANYIQNRTVDEEKGKSPFEIIYNRKPNYEKLIAFGTEGYVMIPKEKRKKLDIKSEKMMLVGYDEKSKGYRMTNGKKIVISREVTFLKGETQKRNRSHKDVEEREVIISDDQESLQDEYEDQEEHEEEEEENEEEEEENNNQEDDSENFESAESEEEPRPAPRRSNRSSRGRLPGRFQDFIMDNDAFTVIQDPTTYQEAMKSKDAEEWKQAIQEELQSIEHCGTWELVELPKGRNTVSSKWVFKTKTNEDGNIERRKARLVARGFTQKYGIDYFDVFAPVARGVTVRMLLSAAGRKKFIVKQFDVKTAFLNGTLEEEIFMEPPEGLNTEGKVCLLKKSLYGLKQAARVWNKTMHNALTKQGLLQDETDNCLYTYNSEEVTIYLLTHVDDFLAATNCTETLDKIMTEVNKDFEVKCIGEAQEYLGINIRKDKEGNYMISQSKLINEIIKEMGLEDGKESRHPMDTGYFKLGGKELPTNQKYRKVVGMLMYVATNSRPDISACVSILSQRVIKPRDVDYNELKRICKYLKGTSKHQLKLSEESSKGTIIGYTDSDWAEDTRDRKSITGWCIQMNGGTISWSCKKQTMVALSSAEAEFMAMTEAAKELAWIQRVGKCFGIKEETIKLKTDSQSALAMVENQKFSGRTKHIDLRYHYIKDISEKGRIKLEYHPTATNIADMMTKPLGANRIRQLRESAGINLYNVEEEC
jgi:transposase InsO family protein